MRKKQELYSIINQSFFSFVFIFTYLSVCSQQKQTEYVKFKDYHIAKLKPLEVYHLNLSKKCRDTITYDFSIFKNLKYLNLSKNKLTELYPSITFLDSLDTIVLNKNKFISFPDIICSLKSLKHLIISNNDLENIPDCIGNLIKLEYLDLYANELSQFSEELKNLDKLKYLDLRVILISDENKSKITNMLPNTKVYFSNGCDCD